MCGNSLGKRLGKGVKKVGSTLHFLTFGTGSGNGFFMLKPYKE